MSKSKLSKILYCAIFAATAVLIVSLSVWAAGGSTTGAAVNYIEGEVALGEGVRNEYLVGEEIPSTGITLTAGEKTYTSEEIEINVDNASAGDKMVEVFHREGSDYYRGYFPVTYFMIRHLDMHQTPTNIVTDEEGNVVGLEGMILWAELSGKPTSFVQPEEEGFDTVIILGEENYTVELEPQDENGGYTAKINCGMLTTSIYFVEFGDEFVILESPNRILSFTNENGTGEALTLFITSRGIDDGANGRINVAEGFFIYRDANGGIQRYQFGYYMSNVNWDSVFSSDIPAPITRRSSDDAMIVQLGDLTFSAPRTGWCLAILDNPNP